MKKLLVLGCMFVLASVKSFGSTADLFQLNELAVTIEMAGLNILEEAITATANSNSNQESIEVLCSQLNLQKSTMMKGGDDLLGIPPFLYGCCFGPIGILLVYMLTDKDKPSIKKSAYGCIVPTGLVVGYYVFALIFAYSVWGGWGYGY